MGDWNREQGLGERALANLGNEFTANADYVATLTARITELEAQLAKHVEDWRLAEGDLPVPLPEPGTDMARLLTANVLMRRQLAARRDEPRPGGGSRYCVPLPDVGKGQAEDVDAWLIADLARVYKERDAANARATSYGKALSDAAITAGWLSSDGETLPSLHEAMSAEIKACINTLIEKRDGLALRLEEAQPALADRTRELEAARQGEELAEARWAQATSESAGYSRALDVERAKVRERDTLIRDMSREWGETKREADDLRAKLATAERALQEADTGAWSPAIVRRVTRDALAQLRAPAVRP